MVRFYCKVCKKIKRVRKFPTRIYNEYATVPADRVGECNKHYQTARKPIQTVNSIGQVKFRKAV